MDAPSSREQKAAEIEREVAKGEVQSTDEAVPYFKLFSGADKVDVLLMFVGTIGSIGAGLGWPIFTILFADFTDSFGSGNASDFTSLGRSLSLNFVYVAVGTAVASFLEVGFWMWTGHRQTRRLRQRYCSALLKQEVAFFDVEGTAGGLLQGLVDDTALIQTAISERVGNFVHNTASFIAGLAIAFWASWELALVMLGCLPFLGIVGAFAARLTDQFTRQSNVIYAEANGTVLEALGQIRTVTAYNQQEWTSEQYKNKLVVPQKVGLRQGLVNGFVVGAVNFVMFCTMAAAFYFGAYRVADNKRTGGDVLTALLSALIGGFALGMAAPNFQHFAKGRAAGAKVFHIIDRHSAIDVDKAGQKLTSLEGRLMLNNVNFAYPARPDALVLRDFSLSIPAGRTVALVGSSGSGKSTVVGLIERFYDPMEGSVTLDGVDLRQLDLLWLRSNIGLVSQEPTLFATTIYENIALGKPGATREEVIAAATAANAHGFISALHHGYDTDVGERGLQMSGGQKQRIAIARAVLKNPRVLLLDEATSALDVHSERIVQRALDNVMVGRTTVVIAHRLSTVRHAHVIAVVSQGQVVEQGTHEELLKKDDGAYMALVRMQLQKETENEDDDELDEELDVVLEELEGASGSGQGEDGEEVQVEIPFSKGPSTREGGDDGLAGKDVELGRLRRRLSEDGARLSRELKKGSRELHDGKRTSKDLKRTSLEGRRPSQDVKHPPETLDLVATSGTKDKEDSMDKNKKPVRVPISRLAALNKPEWAYALVGFLSAAAVGSVQPLFALLFTEMIRVLYLPDKEEKRQEASLYSWMFFVLGVGSIVFATIMHYCFGAMAQKLVARLRLMMLGAILRQDIGWFDLPGNTSGALASRLSTDAMYIRGAVGDALGLIGQYTACLITGFVIAFIYDWRMALVVTGVLPLMVVATAIENKSQLGGVGSTDKNYSAANQVVTDALGAIRVIQSYNLQQYIDDLYDYHLGVITAKMSKRSLISGLSLGYSGFCTFALYGLVIWFAGIEVERGWSSFDDVMKSFMAVTLAAMGLAQAQMDFPHLSKAGPAVQRVFPIIDRVPAIDWHKTEGLEPKEIKGELELQHVKFVYPARPTITVLHDFSLSIPAGRTVALVGSSGSGKSTVVGLIERFYDPVQGQVLLDGVDLRSYHLPWLRAQVGLVSQEPLLFSTTILNNIRYGKPAATMEEVIEAAKIASAEEFIERLADGYNTLVGERGVLLSGGQKQRIAIARAVVRNPRIMLLDEATSALDAQSEKVVQAALDRVMVGRTSVVVAHRLSTIRNADIIAVVSEGRLQEQGKHEELIAHDGAYAKLVQLQMASAMSG